jgi:hypothetical protein
VAKRVFVHIGAPKCGTTFVQSVLLGNRTRLSSDGMLFPGRKIFDHNLVLMAVQAPESESGRNPRAEQTWQALQAEIGDWPGDAILTNEWFVRATDEQASRARRALDGAELHLVYTARAYVQQIPAGWQETLKRGLSRTLPEFVAGLGDDTAKYSWWTLDPVRALSRWAGDAIPASRVHVVTVPPKGSEPGLLWRRFAGVLGIDPDAYDLETAEPNASLSAEAVALLQRLGPELRTAVDADRGHWTEQYRWIRGLLSHRMLAAIPGSPIGIDPGLAATLHHRSVAAADAISHAGYDLVGDLDDLRLTGSPPGSRDPATVTDAELLDVATDLIARLFAEVRTQTVRAERTDRSQRGEGAGNRGVRHDRGHSLDPTTASRGDHDADL